MILYEPGAILGEPPSIRGYHATKVLAYSFSEGSTASRLTAFNDVLILDLAAGAYLPQVTSFTMEAA